MSTRYALSVVEERMTETAKKHCNVCENDYPATTEFFFPSYLKENSSHHICKTCHTARKSNLVTFRTHLLERATPIDPEKASFYQSLNSIATAVGWSKAKVEHDIYKKKLSVYTFIYNNTGPALALLTEDAKAYIAEHELNGHEPAPPKEPQVIGTPATCGCCETNKGNILAVLDTQKEIRAYLCATCYRTAASYKWDPQRMKNMARLIETIGIENLSV
ncbi:MAG TPA: hypothetical protein VFN35_07785 [Ktedonobacteraceae bacterium]|nr:hypothetical protein [Ktedonobacteraceae bacterium]